MQRGVTVQEACGRRLQKRSKCDGLDACSRCQEDGIKCIHSDAEDKSKNQLRCEIDRLSKENRMRDEALALLSSSQHVEVYRARVQLLRDGNKSRQDALKALWKESNSTGACQYGISRAEYPTQPVDASVGDARCTHCLLDTPASEVRRSSFGDSSPSPAATEALSTHGLLTPAPSLAASAIQDAAQSQTDALAATNLTATYIRRLFDNLLTWDYLPSYILCKDAFLQDFHSGHGQYCSPALVKALIALSIIVATNIDGEAGEAAADHMGSKYFFDGAKTIVQTSGQPSSLPDIQALGVLSLYQLSRGNEGEALELAEDFAASITDLCLREEHVSTAKGEYSMARATTFCGAISLVRMLRLTTRQLFSAYNYPSIEDSAFSRQYLCITRPRSASVCSAKSSLDPYTPGSQLSSIQLIPAKVFQLTEWIYTLLAPLGVPAANVDFDDAYVVYKKCLCWYGDFLHLLKADGINTPFELFTHMYYQFCLFLLLRQFVDVDLDVPGIQPGEVCSQAALSILALAESYDRLFSFRGVSGFVPYFVFAAGQYCDGVEDNGITIDDWCLRARDQPQLGVAEDDGAGVASHDSSAANHARLLLAKMRSSHLPATMTKDPPSET